MEAVVEEDKKGTTKFEPEDFPYDLATIEHGIEGWFESTYSKVDGASARFCARHWKCCEV